MWREKWLSREEGDGNSSENSCGQEEKAEPGKEVSESANSRCTETLDINMVFIIPSEFQTPEGEVTELTIGAERAMFEKPGNIGDHMKPLFIKGHLDGKPVG
jgi:hypothetical protein